MSEYWILVIYAAALAICFAAGSGRVHDLKEDPVSGLILGLILHCFIIVAYFAGDNRASVAAMDYLYYDCEKSGDYLICPIDDLYKLEM